MSNVRQRMEILGLNQYADAFEENGVAPGLLPEITNDHLVPARLIKK
jgi:hypothetical protein